MKRTRTPLVLLVAAVLLAASPAAADWKEELRMVEEHLAEDRSAEALRITRRLTESMVERLAPGEAAARAFGSVLALRAMAEAAEGLEDDARFHWGMAEHFRPDLVRSNLARYGEGGRVVTSWILAAAKEEPVQASEGTSEDSQLSGASERAASTEPRQVEAGVEAPRKLPPLTPPEYTAAARAEGIQGVVILQAVIDRAGKVADVKILKSLHPGLDYRTAQAVRSWRFEPARLDGEPVEVYYNFTMNFSLQRQR